MLLLMVVCCNLGVYWFSFAFFFDESRLEFDTFEIEFETLSYNPNQNLY